MRVRRPAWPEGRRVCKNHRFPCWPQISSSSSSPPIARCRAGRATNWRGSPPTAKRGTSKWANCSSSRQRPGRGSAHRGQGVDHASCGPRRGQPARDGVARRRCDRGAPVFTCPESAGRRGCRRSGRSHQRSCAICCPISSRNCYHVTALLVHVMTDRARQFTASDQQDEKTISLGVSRRGSRTNSTIPRRRPHAAPRA